MEPLHTILGRWYDNRRHLSPHGCVMAPIAGSPRPNIDLGDVPAAPRRRIKLAVR